MSTHTSRVDQVDVRGPRFAAWVTTAVLVLILVISTFSLPAAATLLTLQAIIFAIGAFAGPKRSPYGLIFNKVVAPRISPPTEREPVAPLRFAQFVGFVFALAGTVGFLAGSTIVGSVATGFALFAALLNAAFGICLGCQIYPLVTRFRTTGRATAA